MPLKVLPQLRPLRPIDSFSGRRLAFRIFIQVLHSRCTAACVIHFIRFRGSRPSVLAVESGVVVVAVVIMTVWW